MTFTFIVSPYGVHFVAGCRARILTLCFYNTNNIYAGRTDQTHSSWKATPSVYRQLHNDCMVAHLERTKFEVTELTLYGYAVCTYTIHTLLRI